MRSIGIFIRQTQVLAKAFDQNVSIGTLNAGSDVLPMVDATALAILLNRLTRNTKDVP